MFRYGAARFEVHPYGYNGNYNREEYPNYKLAIKNLIGVRTIEIVNEQGQYYAYGKLSSRKYEYLGTYQKGQAYPDVFRIAEENKCKVVLSFSDCNIELNKESFKR